MATGDTAPPSAPSSPPPPLLDHTPSNLSSPLSEPDEKDTSGDEAELDMRIRGDDPDRPNRNGVLDDPETDASSESDDDSKLSEVDINDSEAETERLYDTPPKNGVARDIVNTVGDTGHRRFTDRRERIFERSPSKLQQQLRADIEGQGTNNGRKLASDVEQDGDDVPSSEPELGSLKRPQQRSPSLAKKGLVAPVDEDTPSLPTRQNSADSRKRKRSSVADNLEADLPLKKRTGSIGAADREFPGDVPMVDDEGVPILSQSGNHTAEEDNEEAVPTTEAKDGAFDSTEEGIAAPSRSRKGKRSPTKQRKSKSPEEAGIQDEAPDEPPEDADVQSFEVPTPQAEDDHAEEVDEEAEAAHRNEEERTLLATRFLYFTEANVIAVERKKAAWEELVAIEKQFSSFRER